MPEKTETRTIFTLYEVCKSIKKTLEERYTKRFWVRAELMKLNYYKYSGHAYPDLVQKDDGRIIAQMRGVIWKSDLMRIQVSFLREIQQPLTEGIEILFEAGITYDAVHGISLRIYQIDSTFNLGVIEKEKLQTIKRLKSENIFERNKQAVIRDLPKNVAVISVETSKGWADFKKVVEPYFEHYGLFFMMFPALLQGDGAVASIRAQLQKIKSVKSEFDAVMIIRGGGGEAGLTCYNNLDLCRDICLFPLPVFTGIGHSTNLTVAEMTAFHHAITPTALGEYYVNIFKTKEFELTMAAETVSNHAIKSLNRLYNSLSNLVSILISHSKKQFAHQRNLIDDLIANISGSAFRITYTGYRNIYEQLRTIEKSASDFITRLHKDLSNLERIIRIQDPKNILKKGYAYVQSDGIHITSVDQLMPNQLIQIFLKDGSASARVTSTEMNTNNEQE
ncbi:MAG: exodeoxyribonuclease VII large subunit [Thermaurantimonas sp.]